MAALIRASSFVRNCKQTIALQWKKNVKQKEKKKKLWFLAMVDMMMVVVVTVRIVAFMVGGEAFFLVLHVMGSLNVWVKGC